MEKETEFSTKKQKSEVAALGEGFGYQGGKGGGGSRPPQTGRRKGARNGKVQASDRPLVGGQMVLEAPI